MRENAADRNDSGDEMDQEYHENAQIAEPHTVDVSCEEVTLTDVDPLNEVIHINSMLPGLCELKNLNDISYQMDHIW